MSKGNGKRPTKATRKKPGHSLAPAAIDRRKEKALRHYKHIGTISGACESTRIARSTWYDWMEADAAFAKSVVDCQEAVSDELEQEAVKRAKGGSDLLLIFLLKSRRPDQYRETQRIEVVSPGVRDRLRRTIQLVHETHPPDEAAAFLEKLDLIWQ